MKSLSTPRRAFAVPRFWIAVAAGLLVICGTTLRAGMEGRMAREELKEMAAAIPSKIIFLHHSTGSNVWNGGVKQWFADQEDGLPAPFSITERAYPKSSPYGWNNYPYDYYNIWVAHAGPEQYKSEDTLEILTKEYDMIVFKHCFPVSNIKEDKGEGDVASSAKTLANYKLQYEALKKKMLTFPKTTFVVWTGAALTEKGTSEAAAKRASAFHDWVISEWDTKGDNIHVWDFQALETDGGLYLKNEYAASERDSHPNKAFCKRVAPLFCQRLVNIAYGKGDTTSLTGK